MYSDSLHSIHSRIAKSHSSNHHRSTDIVISDANHRERYKQWTKEHLERAFISVKEDGMSVRHAAIEFGVPKSTLQDRLTGKVQFGTTDGGKRYLSDTEEEELVSFFITVCQHWIPKECKPNHSFSTKCSGS